MRWNNIKLETYFSDQYMKIRNLGFSKEELSEKSLKNPTIKTTSARYGRMVKLAFHLGRLAGIQEADRALPSSTSIVPDNSAYVMIAAAFEENKDNPYSSKAAWYLAIEKADGYQKELSGSNYRTSYAAYGLFPIRHAIFYLKKSGLPDKITFIFPNDPFLTNVLNADTWKTWAKHDWKTKKGTKVVGSFVWKQIYEVGKDIDFEAIDPGMKYEDRYNELIQKAQALLAEMD